MAKEYKYKSSNARYKELSNGFMPTGEYWEKVRQEDDKWNKYLQRQRELQQKQPFNQQQGPTTPKYTYVTPTNNDIWQRPTKPQGSTSGRGPVTSQGQIGAASMGTEYGGKPKTPSLSELEMKIADLTKKAKNAQDRAWTDRNLDPIGASSALNEFKSLDAQIKELEKQRDELAAANNSWMQKPDEQPVASAAQQPQGIDWSKIQNQKMRDRASFPKGMTERPEDYNDNSEMYDRMLYDFYYGKGEHDKIMQLAPKDVKYRMFDDLRNLWSEYDNGRVAEAITGQNPMAYQSGSEPERPKWEGMIEPGNIDLDNRPVVQNADGSISTERSFSVNIDGQEVLLPTVIDGAIVSEDEAINHYYQTGEHLGKFDTPENANNYADWLHNRQEEKYGNPELPSAPEKSYFDFQSDTYTLGGGKVDPTPHQIYAAAEDKEKAAEEQLSYTNAKKYASNHAQDNYANIDAEKEYWTNVENTASDYMDAVEAYSDSAMNIIQNPKMRERRAFPKGLLERPEDYNDNSEMYDRMLYDFYYGKGEHDKIMQTAPQEIKFRMFDELQSLWNEVDSGRVAEAAGMQQNLWDQDAQYQYQSMLKEQAEKELEQNEFKQNKRQKYQDLMQKYKPGRDADPSFIPENDRGGEAYSSMYELEHGVRTNDVHRIYSFLGGGKEFISWANMLGAGGKEPRITYEYSYAMMLDDGVDANGNYNEDHDEIKRFMSLYNEGKYDEAKAFIDGLQYELRSRYTDFEKIDFSEAVRKIPVLSNIGAIMSRQASTYLALPSIVLGAFGVEDVKDPNSWINAPTKNYTMITEETQRQLQEQFGSGVAKTYGVFMQSVTDVINGLLSYGGGGNGLMQRLMGYSSFASQVYMDSLYRNLESMDYTKASTTAIIDAVKEVVEELLPFETMLGSESKGMIRAFAENALSNAGEELAGNTFIDKLFGMFTGEDKEKERTNEIVAQNGYYNQDGEWVPLDVQKDMQGSINEAYRQARGEYLTETAEGTLAGLAGGGFGAAYSGALRAADMYRTGWKVNKKSNNFEGKTGSDLLVDTALGMTGTESEQLAQGIDEKRKKGEKASNYETGRLAATMAEETNEQVGQVAEDTLKNRIKKQLTDAGVAPERADELANVMAQGLMNQGKLSILDRHKIAKEHAAIDLWGSYTSNNGLNANAMGAQAEISEATKGQQSVAQVLQNVTGEGTVEASSAVADEVNRSNKKGSAEEAVEDLSIRRPDLITPEYAEAAKAEAGNSKNNPKTFLDDAVKIRLAVFGLNAMPKTGMDQESAQRLWDAAKAEWNATEAQRLKQQAKLNHGNGAVDYEGAAMGSREWKEKLKGLNRNLRRQVLATAWIARTMGHTVHFEYNDAVTYDENGKEITNERYIYGAEGGDGSITINVAGALQSGRSRNLLATLPHEFTHWLEQNSKEGYAQLRQFIVDNLRAKGMNVEAHMVWLMENENSILGPNSKKKQTLNGAMAEIVAQGCEVLFDSPEMLSRLANEKPTVYAKFKAFLQKLMDELTTGINGLDESLSEEARLLRDVKDEIAKRWLSARNEALGREGEGTAAEAAEEEVSFSVAQLPDGTKYVNVDTEQNIFDEHEETEYPRIVEKYITKRFRGHVIGTKRRAYVDKRAAKEYAHPAKHGMPTEIYNAKARSATELNNLMEVSTYFNHEDDDGTHEENVGGWNYYKTILYIPSTGKFYEGFIQTELVKKGERFHDLTQLKDITSAVQGRNASLAPSDISNNIIKQNDENGNSFSVAQLDRNYMAAAQSGDMETAQWMVDMKAEDAFENSKVRGKDGKLLKVYHGTKADFNVFRRDMIGSTGRFEGSGFNFTPYEGRASSYGKNVLAGYLNIQNPLSAEKKTISVTKLAQIIREADPTGDTIISDYARETRDYGSEAFVRRESLTAARNIWNSSDNDVDIYSFISAADSDAEGLIAKFEELGYDGLIHYDDSGNIKTAVAFNSEQFKLAEPVTYDENGNVIPLSERFNIHEGDIRYSVAQLAQANGMRFDEDTITMYDKNGNVVDGVRYKVTPEMIENTPIGMLINMARDGVTTKGGNVKFKPTISAKTAAAQKKMFADLMNMAARYKDSNLVWEIAGSTLYSALKSNSDPQYSTTVDFGTVCAKTQEIINVMSRVMLEKGRVLTREEVLDVYNQTANAGLTVPCPVCYVFSRWMGVPSLLNQMSKYQKRFVVLKKDGSIDVKATQKKVDAYIREAMKEYGDKATLDKAKTSIMNRMKTQETNRSENLAIWYSKTASAEEKAAAKKKHDAAIQALDELQEELGKVEAYNWVTQALCKETSKNSGKYVVDPAFELTPDSVLFDLRRTGEFAKYAKNWRYRNTRGAGMGKAIMPYSGMSIGDIIFGTERKSDIKNPFLTGKAGAASNGIKNAIIKARRQNLIGGQRLQSTSDYRPEWGLDYMMTFLELQAIGSKVQMYTKVAEAVDLLASMQADVNLSIMGKGNGYHIATEAEIRESRTNAELRSRMGRTYDEEGNMQTYVLDFSDVTGMEYNTAKALTKKHNNVQMILVGMNDIHIRLAMANPDIDFIIPWHSSGNSQDALKSMIASAGKGKEQLETSHNYEDSQTDTPREDQTAEQKKLWELRLKIIQGKVTAEDKKAIEKDEILQGLYERFYVEGVDPDCYQVQLGAEQAKQIFPYEYWDKSLKKAEADGNGRRFIEYCEHFGIRPRFFQFADQTGYWKVLIDRKMYDNDGNYREQKVVDVTKAKIGHLDKSGKLQDSDMPLQTSAMYGDKYSEQEKNAVDNTIAVLDEKARIQAIGTNVTEEEAPRPRNNQSAFGASAGIAAMDTTAISGEEVIAPAKRRAKYVDEEESSFSVMQPNMDVRSFMMGLNEASLGSFQEKAMLRQFKEMNMAREIANERLRKYRGELRALEAKENPSVFDRGEMQKYRNRIKDAEEKLEKAELAMDKATRDKGFANLMHKNERLMKGLVGGRTIEDVQKVIQALTAQVEEMSAEMEKRQKKIDQMRKDLTQRKLEALVNESSARRMAGIIKKEYSSDMDIGELVKALTEIRLKIQGKENIDQDVEDLAWRIAQGTRGEESAVINAMRGTTIVLGPSQMAELKGQHRTIRDVRSDLAGTGIKVTTGNTNTLDSVWKQICILSADLDPDTNVGNQLDELLRVIKAERKAQSNADMFKDQRNMDNVVQELKAMIAAVDMNVPKDPAAVEIINRMNRLMGEMEKGTEESAEELRKSRSDLAEIVDAGNMVVNATDAVQRDIKASIQYNNALAEQSEAALWKNEKFKIIQQLKDKNTEALIKEQQKWKDRIARDKTAREKMNENMHIRKMIHRNITRLKKLIINETDLENVPEYMKSLAREVLTQITNNDLTGLKITGIARNDLMEMQRVLGIMNAQDGRFTEDDLRVLGEEEVQSVIMDALADIEDGITLYNSSTKGHGILENLDMFHTALDTIEKAVATIKTIIDREREISIGDRQILVADAAAAVATDARGSKFKGELKGPGSKQMNAIRRAVFYGNLTPVYFFKSLKNRGMDMQWEELRRAENRNGLELQKAAAKIAEIAEKYHYKDWADKKTSISIYGKKTDITFQQIMSLYAIWKREKTVNPEMSSHVEAGGVYFEQPGETTEGKLRREKGQQKPVKMKEAQVMELYDKLSDEQKAYLNEIVEYLSSDMSNLGNEASMRMYGIKKYKESWYFPMMIWDGVKSARSDKGISGTTENRAAHKGWSKRRKNNANNALVIKDFTDVAVGHIVEMINYNTVAPAIENINKVLNYQFKEEGDEEGAVRRNTRVIFQQAYGRDALNYLETFMQDLNGGTVQDQRKTLREAALSMFKKNAVAGSLSVALQQPLSYIRAAMMISPTALAQAISPQYWKGSYAEMMKYSGVAVIKNMGRFDMNFGRSARDFIAPDKKETILATATDKLTAAPEAMDRMTWTRMWSACKIETARKNPGMDMQSEEFLKKVAERFNDVMQQTQVYDSVMVKSQNMRSNNFAMKMLTSFMAEPTLSLNVLADAVQNIGTKGGKVIAGKAAATFILSAIMQALVKGFMGSGRTPDDKKTRKENFLYKWYSAFLTEADPMGLIPGFSDIVELIRNGKLTDDAMSVIGKMFASIDTANKVIQGEGKGWWRDVEDTAGQIIQLFSDVPLKNLMRDGRAMYNWITQEPYAKRETSGAVLRKQAEEAFWTSDSLLGAINAKLGEAGFQTSNKAYYGRLYEAMQSGNKAEEQDIREYMTLAKGVDESKISSGLKTAAKDKLPAAEASQWMIDNDLMDSSSTLTSQYKKGEITKDEFSRLLKQQDPKLTENDVWWKVDLIDYKNETGDEKASGKGYRLKAAISANNTNDIRNAINQMTKHGIAKDKIKSQYLSDWKSAYLSGDSTTRRKIRDALQKAYKILGYTAEDANKTIENWEKSQKKK